MRSEKKIAIITGITSFLGRSTANFLLSKGFTVYGIVRPDSDRTYGLSEITGLKLIKLDISRFNSNDFVDITQTKAVTFINEIRNSDTDITFIHFGWGATLDRTNFMAQMLNVDYSKKVLEFAKLISCKRFIFAGSQAEYSDSAYGMAKKEFGSFAENDLMNTNMSFIHMRIFSVYGKGDRDDSLLMSLIRAIKDDKDMDLSSCNYLWNFLYIDDFVEIIYRLIKKDVLADTYDIASDDTRILKEYLIEAYDTLNAKNTLHFGARPDSLEKFAIPNIKNTINAIGKFEFTKFAEGIKEIFGN